jgi:hypothetical protein
VHQLLNTELGKSMSAVEIANVAGVGKSMVSDYRKRMELAKSIPTRTSDASKRLKSDKVRTGRG